MVESVVKRDGSIVPFVEEKITNAIHKAFKAIAEGNGENAKSLSKKVVEKLEEKFKRKTPTVEEVQDIVEQVLMEEGFTKVAKVYIIYRQKRAEVREKIKALIGMETDLKLSLNQLRVMKARYLLKDKDGRVIEAPKQMFARVANNIALAEKNFGASKKQIEETAEEFFELFSTFKFLPNSPTLMNAGTDLQQLSGCFVLPIEDDMTSIFEAVKSTALVHQSGGGTGFSFSRLRPKGDIVKSTGGVASGPISFMKVFNSATEVVKQGGKRRGANMGMLRIDHPDIIEFVTCKEKEKELNNFNISVAITDDFMEAVRKNKPFNLINARTKEIARTESAKELFDLIVSGAWRNGEPGVVFIDRVNRDNPTPQLGEIESTNPCGEQPLLPFESCNLGSINLKEFAKNGIIQWEELKEVIHTAVRFLDNVIEMNHLPIKKIEEMTKANRKIGLGVMGFAEMLFKLKIPYNSEEAVETGEKLAKFLRKEADDESEKLGKERGVFPNFKGSIFDKPTGRKFRNATRLTIAPTGSISMIADCSSGIEPLFALSFVKSHVLGEENFVYVNDVFKETAIEEGFYSEELMQSIANKGSIQDIEEIPKKVRKIFVVAHDITPEWHIKMQAAWQKHVDNAISKTINFPSYATLKDVEKAFLLAFDYGCKGITIYRDKSREEQVLNLDIRRKEKEKKLEKLTGEKEICPKCHTPFRVQEGCKTCPSCGFGLCSG